MNREIKFRGQKEDTKKWIYGGYFKHTEEDGIVNYIFDFVNGATRIDIKSIGQFTGLHDKNGLEIYEGDIVSFGGIYPLRTVNFACGNFGFESEYGQISLMETNLSMLEVIGNIHENPELLK